MDLYKELLDFLEELTNYREEVLIKTDSKSLSEYKLEYEELRKLMDKSWAVYLGKYPLLKEYSLKIRREESREELREKLLHKSGQLQQHITKLVGTDEITIYEFGQPRSVNVWAMGLRQELDYRTNEALSACIDNTTVAIGKLESDIEEGIRDKRGKLIEKPATMADTAEAPEDYEARQGKQSIGKESRKHLQGTPEEIAPHIVRVAQEFQFQGFKYLAQEVSYKSSQFSKEFTILCGEYVGPQIRIIGDVEDEEHPQNRHIGTIILQSLANNKTLFISKKKSDDLVDADSYFGSYLNNALKELRELGFVESWPNKAWRVLKELVGVYKAVKP